MILLSHRIIDLLGTHVLNKILVSHGESKGRCCPFRTKLPNCTSKLQLSVEIHCLKFKIETITGRSIIICFLPIYFLEP